MSEKYKFRDPEGIYFVTPTIVGWLDVFTKKGVLRNYFNLIKLLLNRLYLIFVPGDVSVT